jgi:methionyl-tRNA formyltransferase
VRICFLGTPQPAVPALEAFLADPDVDVAAVVTNPDRPSGRGHKLRPPPVKVAAADAGVPVWQPEKPREVIDDLRALAVDACAVVAYGALLPESVLAVGGAGFVNLHFSLLPAWRGAAPVQHAILNGDRETGVTCFVIEKGMDTGPVLTERRASIGPEETAGELLARLAALGAPALVEAVRGLVDGTLEPQPQDHDAASYAPKITPDDAALDWRLPAARLHDAVRAFNPMPGAHTTLAGERLKVHRARVVAQAPDAAPGTVVAAGPDGVLVACGQQALRLDEVQPAGRGRMSAAAFANGYRPLGAVLGAA